MTLSMLIPRWQIRQRVHALARSIRLSYGAELPLFVVLMDGAKPFADMLLEILTTTPDRLDIKAKTYVGSQRFGTELSLKPEDEARVFNRDIVVLDDILETGQTLQAVRQRLWALGAADVQSVVLLERKRADGRRRPIADVGFVVDTDRFLVGFGMDLDGKHRELPDIYTSDHKVGVA